MGLSPQRFDGLRRRDDRRRLNDRRQMGAARRFRFLAAPVRRADFLGRAFLGLGRRDRQGGLLRDQRRARRSRRLSRPPRLRRRRRARNLHLSRLSRRRRVQGRARLQLRAVGDRAGGHLCRRLVAAPSARDQRLPRRRAAAGVARFASGARQRRVSRSLPRRASLASALCPHRASRLQVSTTSRSCVCSSPPTPVRAALSDRPAASARSATHVQALAQIAASPPCATQAEGQAAR